MEERTAQAERDLPFFQQFAERYESMQGNLEIIKNYYLGDWSNDVDNWCERQRKEFHPCISEDYSWNVLDDLYLEKKKLLKLLFNDLIE